jgi:hypothetical protein
MGCPLVRTIRQEEFSSGAILAHFAQFNQQRDFKFVINLPNG